MLGVSALSVSPRRLHFLRENMMRSNAGAKKSGAQTGCADLELR